MHTKCPSCGQRYRINKPNTKKRTTTCVTCGNDFHIFGAPQSHPGEAMPKTDPLTMQGLPTCHVSGCSCHRCRKLRFNKTNPVTAADAIVIVVALTIPLAILILAVVMLKAG